MPRDSRVISNRHLLTAAFLLALGFTVSSPSISQALGQLKPEHLRNSVSSGATAPAGVAAQPTQYEFVEHVIDQVRTCEGNPLQSTRNTSVATYDFTFTSGTEAGCTAVTIPNGIIALNFPPTFTSGVAFTPTINTTGTLQLRVASNHFSVSGKGLTVDAVLHRLPIREDPGVHQDLRNAPCPLSRSRQNPPLNGGTEATPGLNPFASNASCSVTAPAAFQSFEGNNLLIISTIDIVVGENPFGPADFFDYRGIRLLRFTITSKYRPASSSCPALTLQNGTAVPSEVCKLTIDGPTTLRSSDDCPLVVTARKSNGDPDQSFNGMVKVSLAGSTPKIGCLRSGQQCAESLTLPMQNGVLRVDLQTPLLSPSTRVLDSNSVLDLRDTVLKGTARISAEVASLVAEPKVINVQSPLDLRIRTVEVQQGVKQDNVGLWVGERDLIVRVFLEANRNGLDSFTKYREIHGITANLFVKDRTGNEIIDSPFTMKWGSILTGTDYVFVPNAPAAFDGSNSLNYVLSGTFEPQLNFEVKLASDRNESNNSSQYGPLNFLSSRSVTFLTRRLRVLNGADKTEFPTKASIDREREFLKLAWPAGPRALKFVEQPDDVQTSVIFAGGDPLTFRTRTFGIGFWLSSFRGMRYLYFVDSNYFSVIRQSDPEIPLLKHFGIGTGGVTMSFFKFSVLNTDPCGRTKDACGTLAHELGHQFGLDDTYILPGRDGNPSDDGSYSWFHGEFIPGRLDSYGTPVFRYLDFMGNGGQFRNRTWTDLNGWAQLKSNFPFTPPNLDLQPSELAVPAAPAAGSFVIVQGQVNKNGTGIIDACYTLSLTDPQNDATGGDYVIETLDSNSTVINSLNFATDFRILHLEEDRELSNFNYALPFSSAVKQIRLRFGNMILASRMVSANAPIASFISDFNGQTLTGTQQVSWTGSDPDGGTLTYFLFYSPDGQLRMPLTETTMTSYQWNTDGYPSGPSPMLTLVANDGVHATVVDSRPFKLPNRPPRITIQTPVNQSQFKVGDPIELEGSFFDPEEDLDLNPQLQWTSSLSGVLGKGKKIIANGLATGTHLITATAADTEGSPGSDSITVIVRPDDFSRIDATPSAIDFGTTEVGQAKDLILSVRNTGNVALSINSLISNNAQFRVIAPVAPISIAARSQADVVVRFTPLSSVSQSGSLTIGSNASNQSVLNVALSAAATGPNAGAFATVSAANYSAAPVAREAIVAGFGGSLAGVTEVASSIPLPTQLAGTSVKVKDSAGRETFAPLFFVSPGQINWQVPREVAYGPATISIISASGAISMGVLTIVPVSPGLFTANADGKGVPAGFVIRVKPGGAQSSEAISRLDEVQAKFVPAPIDFGPVGDELVLVLFGTGLRNRSGMAAVNCVIDGVAAPVAYAGQQGNFVGLDQINIGLPRSLAGRGEVDLVLTVDGVSNTVRIAFAQSVPVCNYTISPTSQNFNASGGVGLVNVPAPAGCAWSATSNAPWLAITSGSQGSGPGTVNYFVSPNTTPNQRSGTLTIAGQTFNVTQAAGSSTVTVLGRRTSLGPIPGECAPPELKVSFLTTDASVFQWTLIAGAHVGDQVRWEFSPVNGGFTQTAQYVVPNEGTICFWSSMAIAGSPASSFTGNWQVRLFHNNALLFTDIFTINTP